MMNIKREKIAFNENVEREVGKNTKKGREVNRGKKRKRGR